MLRENSNGRAPKLLRARILWIVMSRGTELKPRNVGEWSTKIIQESKTDKYNKLLTKQLFTAKQTK